MYQELDFLYKSMTLLREELKTGFTNSCQNLIKVLDMLLESFRIDDTVVKINEASLI